MDSARNDEDTGRMENHVPELYMFTDGNHVRNFWLGQQIE